MELEVLVQSLVLNCNLVCVQNLPFLISSISSAVDLDSLSFLILATTNIQTSVGLLNVTEVFSLECEDLPPS